VGVAGTHGVAVDPLGRDLGAAAPLDRLVDADEERAGGGEGRDEQAQQGAADGQAGPPGAAQDPVVAREPLVLREARRPQRGGDRPPAGREERADEQDQRVRPHAPREAWREGRQQG
jgi:hypothetical protein